MLGLQVPDLRTALLVGGAIAIPSLLTEGAKAGIAVPMCALSSHLAALKVLDASPVAGVQATALANYDSPFAPKSGGTILAGNRWVEWMRGLIATRGAFADKPGIAKVTADDAQAVLERCLAALDAATAIDKSYGEACADVRASAEAKLVFARTGVYDTEEHGVPCMLAAFRLLNTMDDFGTGRCPGGGASGGLVGDEGSGSFLEDLPGRLFDAAVFVGYWPFLACLKISETIFGAAGGLVGDVAGGLFSALLSSPVGWAILAAGAGVSYIVVRPYLPARLGGGS